MKSGFWTQPVWAGILDLPLTVWAALAKLLISGLQSFPLENEVTNGTSCDCLEASMNSYKQAPVNVHCCYSSPSHKHWMSTCPRPGIALDTQDATARPCLYGAHRALWPPCCLSQRPNRPQPWALLWPIGPASSLLQVTGHWLKGPLLTWKNPTLPTLTSLPVPILVSLYLRCHQAYMDLLMVCSPNLREGS